MAEWFKAAVLKTVIRFVSYREFESLFLLFFFVIYNLFVFEELLLQMYYIVITNTSKCITNVSKCITNVSKCITNVSKCITLSLQTLVIVKLHLRINYYCYNYYILEQNKERNVYKVF